MSSERDFTKDRYVHWLYLVQMRSEQQFVCSQMLQLPDGWVALVPVDGNPVSSQIDGPVSDGAYFIKKQAIEVQESAIDWIAFGSPPKP